MLEPDYVRRVLVAMVERGSARPLGRALEVPEDARSA
jgi:hypothetical protein